MAQPEANFETRKKTLLEETKSTNKKIQKMMGEVEEYTETMWNLNMRCYIEGKEKCVKQWNQYFLAKNNFNRIRNGDNAACHEKCTELLSATTNIKRDITDQRSLEEYTQYQLCAKPCVQDLLNSFAQEAYFVRENLAKFKSEFYPENK